MDYTKRHAMSKEKLKANLCQDIVIIQISANLISFILEQEEASLIPTNVIICVCVYIYIYIQLSIIENDMLNVSHMDLTNCFSANNIIYQML